MNTILGVLALAMLGVEEAPKPPAPVITYEFRVLDMAGVEWREGIYTALQPVAKRGNATIWTTNEIVAAQIVNVADHVLTAPAVSCFSERPAHILAEEVRGLVTNLTRHADGPVNHATQVAYTPETERIRDGISTTISGRKLDQGVLVRVVLEDTHISAVHSVYLTEFQEPKEIGQHSSRRWERLQAKLEVPEMTRNEVAGEWLIPRNGVLLVSLGVHSSADPNGKAVARERLVLVKAEAVANPLPPGVAELIRGRILPPAPPASPLPAPSAPARSLPQATNAQGQPVSLPPLPQEAPAPTARPDSDEPVATPQTRQAPAAEPEAKPAAPNTKDEESVPVGHEGADLDPSVQSGLPAKTKQGASGVKLATPRAGSPRASSNALSAKEAQVSRRIEAMRVQGAYRFWFVDDDELSGSGRLRAKARTDAAEYSYSPPAPDKPVVTDEDMSPPPPPVLHAKTDSADGDCCTDDGTAPVSKPFTIRLPVNGEMLEFRLVPRPSGATETRPGWRRSGADKTP